MEHMIIDITNQLDIFQKGRLDPLAERKGMCVCVSLWLNRLYNGILMGQSFANGDAIWI